MKKRTIVVLLSFVLSCVMLFSSCNKVIISDFSDISDISDVEETNGTEKSTDKYTETNEDETLVDTQGKAETDNEDTDNKVDSDGGNTDNKAETDSDNNVKDEIINGAISAEIVNKNGAKGVLTLSSDDGSHFVYANIIPSDNISTVRP